MAQIKWPDGTELSWSYYYLAQPVAMQTYSNVGKGKQSDLTWTLPKGQLIRVYTGNMIGAESPSKHRSTVVRYAIERCPLIGAYWTYYPNGVDREKEQGYQDTEDTRYAAQIGWAEIDPALLIPAQTVKLPENQIDLCGGFDLPVPKNWWFLTGDDTSGFSSWIPVGLILAAGLYWYVRRK